MINFLIKVLKLVTKCIFRIEINGADNIPKDGSCMVCANHISIWDPIILICYLPRWINFIAKKETENIPVIGWVLKKIGCIFINRDGVDLSAMRQSLKVLSADNVLGIFPTGTREKKHPDAKPKSGCSLLAAKSGTTVVPIGINATYKPFSKIVVNVGKPVDFSEYKGVKCSQEFLEEKTLEIYDKILENKNLM